MARSSSKELFDYSDDEMVENLMLVFRIQYALLDGLKHYIDPDDFNRVIYHQRSTDADDRMKQLLSDADKLLALCESEYNNSTEYMKQSNQCAVSFLHEQCANCPYQDQCKPKIYKRVAKIVTSKAAHERAKIQRKMSSEEFKNYAKLRNGVETVQLCEELRTLCSKSGTCIKQGWKALAYIL